MTIPKPHDPNAPSVDPDVLAQQVQDVLDSEPPHADLSSEPTESTEPAEVSEELTSQAPDPLRQELERLQAAHALLSDALK